MKRRIKDGGGDAVDWRQNPSVTSAARLVTRTARRVGSLQPIEESKIERGDWDSLSDLKLLAAALGVNIEDLVKEEPGE